MNKYHGCKSLLAAELLAGLLTFLILVQILASAAAGQPSITPNITQLQEGTPRLLKDSICVIRVETIDEKGTKIIERGSGALLDKSADGKAALVITCEHLFQSGNILSINCLFLKENKAYPARLLRKDSENDIAALVIKPPQAPALGLSDYDPNINVIVAGFNGGNPNQSYKEFSARESTNFRLKSNSTFKGSVRSGDSGGPIIQRGRVVGVIWGTVEGVTVSCTNQELVDFCKEVNVTPTQCYGYSCQPTRPRPILRPASATVR